MNSLTTIKTTRNMFDISCSIVVYNNPVEDVRKVVESHHKTSKLLVIENCGHVVNIEKWEVFNTEVIKYLRNQKV